MKTNVSFAVLIVLVFSFMSCEKENIRINPGGDITTQTHAVTDFTVLDVAGPFNVEVTFSPGTPQLRIEANANLHSIIEVEEKAGILYIDLEDDTNITGGNLVLNVFVSGHNIEMISASGTAQVELQNTWDQAQQRIDLEGASQFTGTILANELAVNLEGASELHIQGTANNFDLEAEGACRMDGYDFATRRCVADLTGGSEMAIRVDESLKVKAEGASTVYYKGNGIIQEQQLSGGSQIVKVE